MSSSTPPASRPILVLIALLVGIIIALVASILATAGGAALAATISTAGVAFAGTVTFVLLVEKALGLI